MVNSVPLKVLLDLLLAEHEVDSYKYKVTKIVTDMVAIISNQMMSTVATATMQQIVELLVMLYELEALSDGVKNVIEITLDELGTTVIFTVSKRDIVMTIDGVENPPVPEEPVIPEEPVVDITDILEISVLNSKLLTHTHYIEDVDYVKEYELTGDDTVDYEEVLEPLLAVINSSYDGPEDPADKTQLQANIDAVSELVEDLYTVESWETLQQYLDAALVILDDTEASQAEVDVFSGYLKEAMDNLVRKPIDKTVLQETIGKTVDLVEEDYTVESWAVLQEALDAANAVIQNEDATQLEVDEADLDLDMAINDLVLKPVVIPVDKTTLQATIAHIATLVEDSYTVESWSALQQVLVTANGVIDNTEATQEEVNTANTNLLEAITNLQPKPVDPPVMEESVLEETIASAEALVESEYTPESWALLQQSLTAAETLLEDIDELQLEIDDVNESLTTAMDNLVEASETPTVDKTSLQDTIASVASLVEADYTVESWSALQTKLEEASAVVDNLEATQEEVDAINTELATAISDLVLEPVEPPVVDKSTLQATVNSTTSLVEAEYTSETWSSLRQALFDANAVLTNAEATQIEVDDANTALATAISNLESVVVTPPVVDKTNLLATVSGTEELIEEDYTIESWSAMQLALGVANDTLADSEATQEEVDSAESGLSSAVDGLVAKPIDPLVVDKTSLQGTVNSISSLVEAEHTTESWELMRLALEEANIVLANIDATQEEVDQANADLTEAIVNLQKV